MDKNRLAKVLRIITVPPVMVTILIVILSMTRKDIFRNEAEIILSLLYLGIIPVLAYPLQPFIPGFKGQGREGQRSLAFILTLVGYVLAVVTGYLIGANDNLQLIYITYVISVILLTVMNKILHIRASGHACSVTGPLIFLIYFTGWKALLPCIVVGAGSVWSSLKLKRHTAKELTLGSLICVLSFGCAWRVIS